MNASRLWTIGSILVIVAIVAGTWFVGISPQLTAASAANDSRASVEAQNEVHEATLISLQEQFDDIDILRAELAELRKAVPADAALPELFSQIHQTAAANGVAVSSLAFADPSPYAPVEGATTDPELATAMASVSSGAFLVIPVDVTAVGPYQNVMAFVSSLQSGERLMLVHDLTLIEGQMAVDSAVQLKLAGQVFVLLDAAATPPADVPEPTQ